VKGYNANQTSASKKPELVRHSGASRPDFCSALSPSYHKDWLKQRVMLP